MAEDCIIHESQDVLRLGVPRYHIIVFRGQLACISKFFNLVESTGINGLQSVGWAA